MWSIILLFLAISSSLLPIYTIPSTTVTSLVNQLPSNQIVNVAIVVPPKNLALLQTYVQKHVIVNSSQLLSLFIPNETISKIIDYLKSKGIEPQVTLNVISFQATAGEVEKLFHGEFITTTILGKKVYYFVGSYSLGIVLATNLTCLFLSKPTNLIKITQAIAYNSVSPQDIQLAYNISYLLRHGINGSGVNIGILDFEGDPYIFQQLHAFDARYNLPDPPVFKVIPIGAYNPNDGIPSGWALEISLDVEYVHVVAPAAGIYLYVANPSLSIPQAIAYIDQQDQVSVVSQSFGIPEIYFLLGILPMSYLQSMIYEYWLGEAEGITFIAASGDAGGNGYNFFLSPLGSTVVPSSIPYVLSVGGSTLYISGNSTYQTAWSGESVIGSSTGGYSSIFPAPPYQGISGFRLSPDVVADSNPYSGVTVLYYYNETYLVGGTSLAAPIVAGIIALAVQVHGKLGFINPLIYSLQGTKALVPINFGYNTLYTANSSLNPVTGLGYINAGYFVSLLRKPNVSLSIATYNSTFLLGQKIKVVANLTGVLNPPKSLVAYVYNGSSIVDTIQLNYNGSVYVGELSLRHSGVYEIYSKFDNAYGFTYITVGYQAVFIFPIVAIYPIPMSIPVLVIITYPNGSLVSSFSSAYLIVYRENEINGSLVPVMQSELQNLPIINISRLGISISYKSGILEGYVNFSGIEEFGGVYALSVNNTMGLDEIVLGMYIVPFVIPNAFTEPTSAYDGENVTLGVVVESFGMPNITVSFIHNGKVYYSTQVNAIVVDSSPYYIAQVKLPSSLPSGYYIVEAYGNYSNGTYVTFGSGYTQIYIANKSLLMSAKVNSIAFENSTVIVNASIYYPNGTKVTYGIFSAIFVPSYLSNQMENLQLSYSVSLQYENGYWVGRFSIPPGSYNGSGATIDQLAGSWDIYIVGSSADGIPLPFNSTLNYNSLSVQPISATKTFLVLPYNFVPVFTGSYAYHIYADKAIIENKTAIFIDSIVNNLIAINSTIYSYASQFNHTTLVNSKIINVENVSSLQSLISVATKSTYTTITSSKQIVTFGGLYVEEYLLALAILGIAIAIYIIWDRRSGKR